MSIKYEGWGKWEEARELIKSTSLGSIVYAIVILLLINLFKDKVFVSIICGLIILINVLQIISVNKYNENRKRRRDIKNRKDSGEVQEKEE